MKKLLVLLAAAVTLIAGAPGIADAHPSPKPPPGPVTVASDLRNPRQLEVGPFGTLFVAEAGSGIVGASVASECFDGPEGPACIGDTSALTAILFPGTRFAKQARVVDGLMSVAGPDGSAAVGLDAVSFNRHGRLSGIMTWAPPDLVPDSLKAQNGQLLRIGFSGVKPVADIGSFTLANPLPGHPPESDPYGVLDTTHGTFVADAAGNYVLKVSEKGEISIVYTTEFRPQNPIDGVPTSIAEHGGKLYVGQLSSLAPGAAKVTVMTKSGTVIKTIDGLSSVNGVAVAPNGDVYVTQLFTGAPFGSPGAVTKIPANGGARVDTPLDTPGGVAVSKGHVYVSVNSLSGTDGAVVRLPA